MNGLALSETSAQACWESFQKTLQSGGIQTMDIKRSGSQPSDKGSAEYFIGAVRIDYAVYAATKHAVRVLSEGLR